jgi:hypothetical protein
MSLYTSSIFLITVFSFRILQLILLLKKTTFVFSEFCGMVIWNLCTTKSENCFSQFPLSCVFTIQKKCIRIITDSKPRESWRLLFKKLKIMTMFSQYIYSSIIHTVINRHLYLPNYEIHKYRTRYKKDLHLPIVNTKKYKEGLYFSAIKLHNHLPEYIKSLSSDQKRFKNNLKEFLCQNSFYSIQEYYEFKDIF